VSPVRPVLGPGLARSWCGSSAGAVRTRVGVVVGWCHRVRLGIGVALAAVRGRALDLVDNHLLDRVKVVAERAEEGEPCGVSRGRRGVLRIGDRVRLGGVLQTVTGLAGTSVHLATEQGRMSVVSLATLLVEATIEQGQAPVCGNGLGRQSESLIEIRQTRSFPDPSCQMRKHAGPTAQI
jgi:hypothetical protein